MKFKFLFLFLVIVFLSGLVVADVNEYNYFRLGELDSSSNLIESSTLVSGVNVQGFVCSNSECSGNLGSLWGGELYTSGSGMNLVYPTVLQSSYGYGFWVYKAGYVPYWVKGVTWYGTGTVSSVDRYLAKKQNCVSGVSIESFSEVDGVVSASIRVDSPISNQYGSMYVLGEVAPHLKTLVDVGVDILNSNGVVVWSQNTNRNIDFSGSVSVPFSTSLGPGDYTFRAYSTLGNEPKCLAYTTDLDDVTFDVQAASQIPSGLVFDIVEDSVYENQNASWSYDAVNADYYEMNWRMSGGSWQSNWDYLGTTSSAGTSLMVTPGTYYFLVRACNGVGCVTSNQEIIEVKALPIALSFNIIQNQITIGDIFTFDYNAPTSNHVEYQWCKWDGACAWSDWVLLQDNYKVGAVSTVFQGFDNSFVGTYLFNMRPCADASLGEGCNDAVIKLDQIVVKSAPLPPTNCIGSWKMDYGSCNATACGTSGNYDKLWTTTTPAANGGTACPSPVFVNNGGNVCSAPACVLVCTDSDLDGSYKEGGACGSLDCDDNNAAVYPGAVEVCGDGIDNDCDGQVDEGCNLIPTVFVSASPLSGVFPLDVSFSCQGVGGDGSLSYFWDFDDGDSSSSQNPSHVFSEAGNFSAGCQVSDGNGDVVVGYVEIEVGMQDLNVGSLICFDQVVEGFNQSCSISVEDSVGTGVGGADVDVYYSDGSLFGSCLTDSISGACAVKDLQNLVGNFEVYAVASKVGFGSDDNGEPKFGYEVLVKEYVIVDLRIFSDSDFIIEDYDFFRGEDLFVSFGVEDILGNAIASDLISNVSLISSLAGGSVDLDKIIRIGNFYYYNLTSIPITHDFLGDSNVFAFVFDVVNSSGGQQEVSLIIRNNLPVISPGIPVQNVGEGEMIELNLSLYESDVEDYGNDLKWEVVSFESDVDVNLVGKILFVSGKDKGSADVVLRLFDLDGDYDEQAFVVKVGDDDDNGNNNKNGCDVEWECSTWSVCNGGVEIRSCFDAGRCGKEGSRPVEYRSCSVVGVLGSDGVISFGELSSENKLDIPFWFWIVVALMVLILLILFLIVVLRDR